MPASVLNTATGVMPAGTPAVTVAVSVKVMLPVRVSVPVTAPLTVQVWPAAVWPMPGTSAWPASMLPKLAQGSPTTPVWKPPVAWAWAWAWAGVRLLVTFVPVATPVTVPKPPPTSGKATVIVAPCRTSPAVVPLQVVVNEAVVGEQANCSPDALTVVGTKIVGTAPTSAFAGPVAVKVNTPEPVLVQVPVTAPVAVQVWPIVVAQGTPGVPDGGWGGGGPIVGVAVLVGSTVPVAVTVAVAVVVAVAVAAVVVAVGDTVSVGEAIAVGVNVSVGVAWLSMRLNAKCGPAPSCCRAAS